MPVACPASNSARIDWGDVDLYRFFAFVCGPPSRERFQTLAQPGLNDSLAGLWKELRCPGDFPGLAWFSAYEEYEAAYIALFDVGIPEPPVPLFESGHDKTRAAQEIALENTWFHETLGLRWDSRCATPDYLITQLEFLAAVRYTLENARDGAASSDLARLEADFLSRHVLNWVPGAAAKLNRLSASAFGPFLTLLAAFLRARFDAVNSAGDSQDRRNC